MSIPKEFAPERVIHAEDGLVHWTGSGLLGHETMCGYVDTPRVDKTTETDRKVNCRGCLQVAGMFAALFKTKRPID